MERISRRCRGGQKYHVAGPTVRRTERGRSRGGNSVCVRGTRLIRPVDRRGVYVDVGTTTETVIGSFETSWPTVTSTFAKDYKGSCQP